ncbi:MAG: NAD(P)-dependent oxidoreductase [Ilumatobacteraceae bacterium]|nr:NAD(P)-dependent oxidoreductase [Ilumatobacteraceae bacterium]
MYPSSVHGSSERCDDDVERLRTNLPEAADVIECFDRPLASLSGIGRDRLDAVDVAVVLGDPSELIGELPRLAWVQMITTGIDHVDTAALATADIRLTTAAGTSSPEIAEFVVARLLEQWKRLPELADLQLGHRWDPLYGRPLQGSKILLVGFGAINRAVATRLAPFQVELRAVRRSVSMDVPDVSVITFDELDAGLAWADAVLVALPGHPDLDGLFDARRFAEMRPGTFFCNVGRGSAVCESALTDALASGHLGGVALDVTRVEPLPPDDELWGSGARISPHCSSAPEVAISRVLDLTSENLRRFAAGSRMHNEVSFDAE